jgi:hypothetical protein
MSPRLKTVAGSTVAALACGSYVIFAYWYSVAPTGNTTHLWIALSVGILIAIALGIVLVSLIALLPKRREKAITSLASSVIFIVVCIAVTRIASPVRMAGFEVLAARSETLIAAIKRYESEHDNPPETLDALVPEYLDRVPDTGMGAYPNYRYLIGERLGPFGTNKWVLVVNTPSGGINFDQFLFLPNGEYQKEVYGSAIERVHEWGYIHE